MGTKDKSLRKIKEVNGWKINHPHNAANIFYAIFTLIILAGPVAYLFLPIVTLVGPTTAGTPDPSVICSFNGVDLIKAGIEMVKFLKTHKNKNSFCPVRKTDEKRNQKVPNSVILSSDKLF